MFGGLARPFADKRDYAPLGRLSRTALLLAALWTGPATAGDISANVPIDHWAYRFIERCETKGYISGVGDGIKPFSRHEVAVLVARVTAASREGLELTPVEAGQLRRLEIEFADQGPLKDIGIGEVPADPWERARSGHMPFEYRAAEGHVGMDLLARQQTDLRSGRGRDGYERVFRNRFGGVLRGSWGETVGFRLAFEQTREQGSRDYVIRDDVYERRLEFVQLKGGLADYHQGAAYLTFALPFARVQLGKDAARWGPAPDDNLGLSDNAPAYDMIRLSSRLGAFKLVSIAGSLRPCPDRPDSPLCAGLRNPDSYIDNGVARRLEREKYISAHRFEVALAPWFDLGFQEMVVYGDRAPEWAYLNPVMFYWAAQSYLGDKDNVMMGIDFDVRPRPGMRLYLAYVVDDLKKLKVLSDDFANKFSLQSGFLFTDPLGVADTDLRGEYVRIEPWIFTHKIPINTYRHFDSPLGHALGPNSDRWRLQVAHRPAPDWEFGFELSRTRHGDNVVLEDGSILNVGGDLHLGWRAGDEREGKDFLSGNLGRRTWAGGQVSWRFLPRALLALGYGLEWGDNVPLPPRDTAGVALKNRTGYGDGGQNHLSFVLRYGHF